MSLFIRREGKKRCESH